MHEDLLGYLLGALSADEQRRVEDALAADPQLRRELERIRRSLEPLETLGDDEDPPAGLADRTLEAIERQSAPWRPTPRSQGDQAWTRPADHKQQQRGLAAGTAAQPRFYSISDGIVLALVGLTAITLLLPALANSRYAARKGMCQNNLREIGSLLIDDSVRHSGVMVSVPVQGKRAFDGVYATTLLERQLIPANSTALLCPGVDRSHDDEAWRIPSFEEVEQATGPELDRLQRSAGGSYSYVVGYVDKAGEYHGVRNRSRPYYPILADAPSLHLEDRQSANHGGRGQNIFYEDGHVTFVTRITRALGDDPFRNDLGHAEAGTRRDDSVLLRSEWPPLPPAMETDTRADRVSAAR